MTETQGLGEGVAVPIQRFMVVELKAAHEILLLVELKAAHEERGLVIGILQGNFTRAAHQTIFFFVEILSRATSCVLKCLCRSVAELPNLKHFPPCRISAATDPSISASKYGCPVKAGWLSCGPVAALLTYASAGALSSPSSSLCFYDKGKPSLYG